VRSPNPTMNPTMNPAFAAVRSGTSRAAVVLPQTSFNDPSGEAGKEVPMTVPSSNDTHDDAAAGRAVLDEADISRALTRIAHEILERNKGVHDVVLLGIPTRGVDLADRLGRRIAEVEAPGVGVGALDVTMYRDDLRMRPARALGHTVVPPGGVDGKVVVLIDDVLFSGRTIRAALTALDDVGRPRAVQLGVLVDRGHRELPIRADFVGKNLPTAADERVTVRLRERDGQDAVVIAHTRTEVRS
jgi:pyrimidine operon attenuation protein / uracil phosphoribosyltransferase